MCSTKRLPELGDGLDQVGQGPTESVELPHNQCISLLERFHGATEAETSDGRAAHALVGAHLRAPRLLERIALQCEGLVTGRNAGVANSYDLFWNGLPKPTSH